MTAARTSRQNVRPTTAATRTCERSAAGSASSRASIAAVTVTGRAPAAVPSASAGQELLDEERVALGARDEPVDDVVRRRVGDERGSHRLHVGGGERAEDEARVRGQPGTPRPLVEQLGPRERQHGAAGLAQLAAEVLDQVELARRGPVDVLVDDEHRPLGAEALEHPPQRQEEEALGNDRCVRAEPEEEREVARRVLRLGGRQQRGDSRDELLPGDLLEVGVEDAERLPDELGGRVVAGALLVRNAAAAQDETSRRLDLGPDLADEPRLADARGADDGDELRSALVDRLTPDRADDVQLARRARRTARAAPAAPTGSTSGRTASQASTGSAFPFASTGGRASYSTAWRVARCVSLPTTSRPAGAAACSRAAVLTTSPIAKASPASGRPIVTSASPVFTAARAASIGPLPRKPSTAVSTRRPARTARSASSPWASGAPKTAITASPMNFSSRPPYASIWSRAAAWKRVRVSRTSSGSACSAAAVKPSRSTKRMETSRRSSRRGAASGAPQWEQKRASASALRPHRSQTSSSRASIPTCRVSCRGRLVTKCHKATRRL